jgi:hypothetical protein
MLDQAKRKTAKRRVERVLFLAAFLTYGYFHQGGGWAQNARFAMVRALVEEGHYWIDNYLIYTGAGTNEDATALIRLPIIEGVVKKDGVPYALTWVDAASGRSVFINQRPNPGAKSLHIEPAAVSGDLAYADGHLHPNKAPGVSLLAAAPYFVIYRFEKLFGFDPDDWWTLTCNAWLTSAFSEGLLSAIGCVLVFRLALAFSLGKIVPSVLTAIAFALGTMFFPLATLLQDQNIAAVLLVASFYLLFDLKHAPYGGPVPDIPEHSRRRQVLLSGFFAGLAVICNYVPIVAVPLLGAYLGWGLREKRLWRWFALGVAGPLLLLGIYNLVCFGSLLTSNYQYVNPEMGHTNRADAGMLVAPRWDVLLTILFSPFRGMFFSAPVLLMGVYGLFSLIRDRQWRTEGCLFASVFALYLWFNASFGPWHGGWIVVPRYLGPAIPFVAVPMVFGFIRFPKITGALAIISVAVNLLFTAVDPQVPTTFEATTNVAALPQWRNMPLRDYTLPMFLTGHAGPMLDLHRQELVQEYAAKLDATGTDPKEKSRLVAALERRCEEMVREHKVPESYGPVSGNPTGVYEGTCFLLFAPASHQVEWNSFNAGEFIFPQSRLSLLPLAVACGGLLACALVIARRAQQ